MITEFPLATLWRRPRQNIQTQLLEVAFSTYMQMSKNQQLASNGPADVWIPESLPWLKLKNGRVCFSFIPHVAAGAGHHRIPRSTDRGRDRIRTCDPALIKRML